MKVFKVEDFYGSMSSKLDGTDSRIVHGWANFLRPAIGDRFVVNMVSGNTGIFEITSVRWANNPSDMFFATVKGLRYVEELGREGAAP